MKEEKNLDKAVITIECRNGGIFEIGVAGYEFPVADDFYDLNWLSLSFRAKNAERDDNCNDACMLTWELEHLADGLESFLSSTEKEFEPYFTENTLWMEFRKNAAGGVDMVLDFTSEGKMSPTGEWERFRIERTVTEFDLRRAIKVMRISCATFPRRGDA